MNDTQSPRRPRTHPTIAPGDGDRRHGTTNGYVNLSCWCDDCRKAWAEYTQARRIKAREGS